MIPIHQLLKNPMMMSSIRFAATSIPRSNPYHEKNARLLPVANDSSFDPPVTPKERKKEVTDEGKTTRSIATREEPYPVYESIQHARHRFDEPRNNPIAYQLKREPKNGVGISVGGPLLTMRLVPTEDELRSRYNPDLLKKSNDEREERQEDFDVFVNRLKEYSRSDKPIWTVMIEEEERQKKAALSTARAQRREADTQREQMRREAGLESK
ncbi:hypothetical protein E4U61_006558 [Claviceps capensis]|nr:hypothetical protein E4U61_006558 [Claviceps capensis]